MSPEKIKSGDTELFSQEPFFSIAEGDREFARSLVESRSFDSGESLSTQGNTSMGAYFIRSGKVKLTHTDITGRGSIIDVFGIGGIIGMAPLLTHLPYHVTASALEPTRTYYIDHAGINQLLARSPGFTQTLLDHFAKRTLDQVTSLHGAYDKVPKRVASALLTLGKLYTALAVKNGEVSFPVRRADLAKLSGTTIESAVRCLSRLKDEGIISGTGRDIRILKPDALRDFANSDHEQE